MSTAAQGGGPAGSGSSRPRRGRAATGTEAPFVGRDEELSRLLERIEAGSSAVLTGPAGIGKTRLAREAARAIEGRQGWVVVTRQASRSLQELPLGLLSDLIENNPERTSAAEAIAAGYRSLVDRLPPSRSLVVVDDIDLVDGASALVLQRLIENGAVSVLFTLRRGELLPDGLAALARGEGLATITLGELDRRHARDLAARVAAGRLDPGELDDVCRVAGGLPLFLLALVRNRLGAVASGEAVTGLAQLIATALGRPDDDDLRTLQYVALGEPLELSVLEAFSDEAALERLEAAGLIAVERDRRRRLVRMAHPLYAEATTASLGEVRRRRLLRDLAGALERYGARRDDTLRAVLWRLAAGDDVSAEAIVAAARQAVSRGDLALAERLVRDTVGPLHSAEVAVLLASIALESGRPQEAAALCAAAPDSDDDAVRTRLAITWSIASFAFLGDVATAQDVLERFRAVVQKPWRHELDYFEIGVRFYTGDVASAVWLVDSLLTEPDLPERSQVWFMLPGVLALATNGRVGDAVTHGEHMAAKASQYADVVVGIEAQSCCVLVYASTYHGDLRGRAAMVRTRLGEANASADATGAALLSLVLGLCLFHEGRFAEAEQLLRLEAGLMGGWSLVATVWRIHALAALGRTDDAAALVDDLGVIPQFSFHPALNHQARGELAWAQRDLAAAVEQFEAAAAFAQAHEQHAYVAVARLRALGVAPSDERADALAVAGQALQGPLGEALVRTAAAWVALDPAAIDRERQHLEELGSVLVALHLGDLAAALVARLQPGSAAARNARAQAERRWARHRRMVPEHPPAAGPAPAADAPPTQPPAPPAPPARSHELLTTREREVVERAAAGVSDNEIAAALQISPRTVHAHLRSAYRKLGISGRADLRR